MEGRSNKGDIPANRTDNYSENFNTIKNNLNTCIDAVNSLVGGDSRMLAEAAAAGKISKPGRNPAAYHIGD